MNSVEQSKRGIFNWKRATPLPTPRSTSPKSNENKKTKRIPNESSELKSTAATDDRILLHRIKCSIDSQRKTEAAKSTKAIAKDVGDLGSPWQRANVSVKPYNVYLKKKIIQN